MTVTELLAQSRAAHQRYRRLHADTRNKSLLQQGEAIREALRARTEAHALDPAHADPAWRLDRQTIGADHEALVEFYVKYLAPAEIYAQV